MPKIDGSAVINGLKLTNQVSDPSSPAAGAQVIYSKSDGLYIKDSAGTVVGPLGTGSGEGVVGGTAAIDYVLLRDQKASGTFGGTFTAGSWQTRVLNTELVDSGNIASISSNIITLAPGTYRCQISAPAIQVGLHKARLYNVTDDLVQLVGSSEFSDPSHGFSIHSKIIGSFSISVQTDFRIEHYCGVTQADGGLGIADSYSEVEVYTVAEFWRETLSIPVESTTGYVMIQDRKTSGVEGGTFTSGAWRTRDLNTIVSDTGDNVSISNNQITLSPGTYRCSISAIASSVNGHQAKLYNITDSVDVLLGTMENTPASPAVSSRSIVSGVFTISTSKVLEVRHQCQTTCNASGFGYSTNFETEIFTTAEFWKQADINPVPPTTGYILIQDQKASGSDGGDFTSGAWRTRVLNTEVADTGNHASIASNQITLAAGTYICHASVPAFNCNRHQAQLYNITGSTVIQFGSSELSTVGGFATSRSVISCIFTISVPTILEIQHSCTATSNTIGFGISANLAIEIYTIAEFWKVA